MWKQITFTRDLFTLRLYTNYYVKQYVLIMGKEFEGMPQPKGDKQYTIFGIVAIVGFG